MPRGAGPRYRGPVRQLQESDRAGWPPGTRRKENDGTGGYALPSFPSLAHPLPPGVGARQGRGASRATEIHRGETRTGLHGGEGGGRAPQPPLSRAGGWGEGDFPPRPPSSGAEPERWRAGGRCRGLRAAWPRRHLAAVRGSCSRRHRGDAWIAGCSRGPGGRDRVRKQLPQFPPASQPHVCPVGFPRDPRPHIRQQI